MPDYRRSRVPGGSYFFTVNLCDRRSDLLIAESTPFAAPFEPREGAASVSHRCVGRAAGPHALPVDAASGRCRLPGAVADRSRPRSHDRSRIAEDRRASLIRKREAGIWQRRYWEHTIRDEQDFAAHMDYIHFNPVKHRLAAHPADWPFSSFADVWHSVCIREIGRRGCRIGAAGERL